MLRGETELVTFARALSSDWLARMSGPLSVPAAALALWVSNETAKTALGITAFVCLWATAWQLWYRERERAIQLEQQLQSVADPIAMERKAFVERAFLGLGAVEIQWLDRMQMSGRPTGCPDETWRALERSGLVERDFAGPKGIKDELRVAIANALSVRRELANALEIVVGVGSKYRKTETNPRVTTETIFVGLRNSHSTQRITNCKILVRFPEQIYAYPCLLDSGLSLEPQHEHLSAVAYFYDYKMGAAPVDQIRVPFNSGGTFAQPPTLPIESTFIVLDAEATETSPRSVRCKIWLDEKRHLQLEEAP